MKTFADWILGLASLLALAAISGMLLLWRDFSVYRETNPLQASITHAELRVTIEANIRDVEALQEEVERLRARVRQLEGAQ